MAQVKGSYAGDIGWNAAAGEHFVLNRRHGAPDRYQSLPVDSDADTRGAFHTSVDGFASDRHGPLSPTALYRDACFLTRCLSIGCGPCLPYRSLPTECFLV